MQQPGMRTGWVNSTAAYFFFTLEYQIISVLFMFLGKYLSLVHNSYCAHFVPVHYIKKRTFLFPDQLSLHDFLYKVSLASLWVE